MRFLVKIYPIILLLFCATTAFSRQHLNESDLLFVVNNEGNHITQVTQGDNLPIDHVAIVHYIGGQDNGIPFVIEAIHKGVCITPLDTFIVRNTQQVANQSIVVGRVNQNFSPIKTVQNALRYVGKPYDFVYDNDDTAIYCSELVLKAFVTDDNTPLFDTVPMTFRDSNGEIPQFWLNHYNQLGLTVPEGMPGSNPAELSRRNNVSIIGLITDFDF